MNEKITARPRLAIKCGPNHRDDLMVRARTTIDYLKDNLEIYGSPLNSYLNRLSEGGKVPSAVRDIKGHIRTFLARCRPMPPEEITFEVMAEVENIMVCDQLTPNKINAAMINTARFIEYLTGNNPCKDYYVNSSGRWFDGHLGDFRFQDQLDQYQEYLENKGYRPATIVQKNSHIVNCCRVLTKEKHILFVSQIDTECYAHLQGLMGNLNGKQADKIIHDLDEFVIFCCGKTLLRDYRKGRRISKEYERTDEWEEFVVDLESFIEDSEERGLRPQTLKGYRKALKEGYAAILDRIGTMRFRDIDFHVMRRLRKVMTEYKQRTVRQYLTVIGRMVEFLTGNNPYCRADMVWPVEPVERTWIFKDEWKTLWNSADVTQRLILALTGGMGLRRFEVAQLNLSDIQGNIMTIRGKGCGVDGKTVRKQIPPTVMKCIEEYKQYRNEVLSETEDLSDGNLIIRPNSRLKGTPATQKYIEVVLKELTDKERIHASCHTMRRFYCTSLVDAGLDMDTVRRMMRHNSLDTTLNVYLCADPRKLDNATAGVEDTIFG